MVRYTVWVEVSESVDELTDCDSQRLSPSFWPEPLRELWCYVRDKIYMESRGRVLVQLGQ